jgi:hypothetical protein
MTEEEAFDAVLASLPRNDDGSVDEKSLIDGIAELIDFDEATERRNKAVATVKRQRKPGTTAPEGQLVLPGIEPYAYEPERLVADNAGHVIEQKKAPVTFKQAEAERARANADRQSGAANRKEKEAREYARWVIEQATEGRDIRGLGFDDFIHDAGLWRPGPADSDPTWESEAAS